ncbi:MAG: acyltransferase [Lysobacterales bacterium]|jgi:peptidoglycan/LPS O-acetylase OafA/YrhL
MNSSARTLINIQFLRFAAAMLVVLFHCADHLRAAGHPAGVLFGFGRAAGFAGVDIFFVISGFIMVWTTRDLAGGRASWAFARRRMARIYSGYWPFYLLAIGLFSVLGGAYLANVNYLGSALLWPTHLRNLLIPVSWTLIFEMYFYLLFTLLIAFGLAQRTLAFGALASAAAGWALYSQFVRHAYAPGQLEIMSVYEQYLAFPYLLEFLAGSLLALFLHARPRGPGWSLLAAGVGLFLAGPWVNEHLFAGQLIQGYFVIWRVLLFGTASVFLVAGLVRLEERGHLCPRRFSLWAGGASYALYLGHTLVLAGTHALGLDAWLSRRESAIAQLAFVLLAALMLAASILWYRWLERPLHRGFRRLLRA